MGMGSGGKMVGLGSQGGSVKNEGPKWAVKKKNPAQL
jgi:hypothetical protein